MLKSALAVMLVLCVAALSVPAAGADVELYDLFEVQVANDKTYANPFDYREIELQAVFTSPSGKEVKFFGFHDGDGKGGQTGNVWKLRFMPQEKGAWKYAYTWTDKTPGGDGKFNVVDTKKHAGPLKIATDNPWYFMTARGQPFDARGYMFPYGDEHYGYAFNSKAAQDAHFLAIDKHVVGGGYNLVMIIGRGCKSLPATTTQPRRSINEGQTWWFWDGQKYDYGRYQVATWGYWDRYIESYRSRGIYVFPFTLVHE